jgi:uncharacterized protein YkwD
MSVYSKAVVALALSVVPVAAALHPPAATASSTTKGIACDGVRLLAAPYIVLGVGPQVIDVSGVADDLVVCQPLNLRPVQRRTDCDDAHVPGVRLKPRLAAKSVRCLINEERRRRGLRELDGHSALKKAANGHSRRMVSAGCFAHTCPGEPDLVRRVTSTGYLPCGACTWSVGENIAWGQGRHSTPAATVAAWMASPGHRQLILTGSMEDVDIGVRTGKPGNPGADAATYTADFGYRD